MKTVLIILLFLGLFSEFQAMPTHGSCQARYKDALDELFSVGSECGEAELLDCCTGLKLHTVFPGYSTNNSNAAIFKVQSACDRAQNSFRGTQNFARCDMKSDKGGWLVIFRRNKTVSSPVNFNRVWADYENGFGDLETEFWYGLREMHCLTQEDVDMRLDITYTNGTSIVWTYGLFKVDGPTTSYTLHIGQAVGSPGTHTPDAITSHIRSEPGGTPFSTRDKDNDGRNENCAAHSNILGGWWWYDCGNARLTRPHTIGMIWKEQNQHIQVSFVEMKIRPKSCHTAQDSCS